MPSKIGSKAFIALMIVSLISLLVSIALAAPVEYFYDELNRLKEVRYPDGTIIKYDYDKLGNITYKEMLRNGHTLTVQNSPAGLGTLTSSPAGLNCGQLCTVKFNHGTGVTLTADPANGYALTGWSVAGCGLASSCTFTLNADTIVTATYGQIFDIYMTEVSSPSLAAVNGTITVHNTVANSWVQAAGPFHVKFYLSANNVIATTDTYLGERLVNGLAPGASDTADTVLTIPANLAPGAYFIGAIANPTGEVTETSLTNNAMAGNLLTTSLRPDLIVTAVSGPVSVNAEPTISVSSTVKNQGLADAGIFDVRFYLSVDSVITTNDVYLGSRTVNSLGVNAEETAISTVSMPVSVTSGTYYIGAIADAGNFVSESHEANNSFAGTQIMVYHGYPDLVMTAVSGPAGAYTGKAIPVTHTVKNLGSGPAGSGGFSVHLYLSTDNVITPSDTYLGSRLVDLLEAGAEKTFTNLVSVPVSLATGTYFIGAISDAQGNANESDEANNAFAGNQINLTLIGNHLIDAGDIHTVALKPDGTLWLWGNNWDGQLGLGNDPIIYSTPTPTRIGSDIPWNAVAPGGKHTTALKLDGTLWAWGDNGNGQLGDVTTTDRYSPVPVATTLPWVTVSAGYIHTAALKSDGTLWTWGDNYYGQLGDTTTAYKTAPVQIGTESQWMAVSGGDHHTMALKTDGTLWAWGANWGGQLGDSTMVDKHVPVQVGTDNQWVAVSTGGYHTMALKADSTLWAWGTNYDGQLGNGTHAIYSSQNISVPQKIGTDRWIAVAAGNCHTVALKEDGTLWTWGCNSSGQLGYVPAVVTEKYSPKQIGTDNQWVAVAAGRDHTLAMKSDGTVWAWGENVHGQLGDGTTVNRSTPVQAFLNMFPPVADFTGSPTSDFDTITVNFTDLSTNAPASWQWNFGDGATSTLRNPSHTYTSVASAATYTVTLTATNSAGSSIATKSNYITVQHCPNLPVRIAGTTPTYYSTLQAAYNAAGNNAVIQMRNLPYSQSLNANRTVAVSLEGGKSCDFTNTIGVTTLQGSITTSTSAGTVTIKDFVLTP